MSTRLQRTRHLRSKILWAAAEMFRKKGYHESLVADIARELGMAKPTLYHYFKSKQELLFESHLLAAATVVEDLREIRQRPESAEVRLRQAIISFMVAVVEKVPLSSVLVFQNSILSPAQRKKIVERRDEADQIFRSIISDGIAAGDFVAIDAKIVSLIIIGAMNWLPHWYSRSGPLSVHELGHRFADYLIRGLAGSQDTRAHMAAAGIDDENAILALTVAVLGVGSTLGQAVALSLARGGSRIVAMDRREASARQVAEAIQEIGGEAVGYGAILSDAEQWEPILGEAAAQFKHLDALVYVHDLSEASETPANGKDSVFPLYAPTADMTAVARAARHVFGKEGRGNVLFVVRAVVPGRPEADLEWFSEFTRALARDLASSGVRANAVLVKTGGGDRDAGSLRDMLAAVRLLLSSGGPWLTGQVIRLSDVAV
ncbi:MAG: SDR family NAD(P)-dependent oxidoreductase [Candidatus Rokubacteria bacterium]|nr:SDR family NAD(P)-dependent oxidoreductase [Candidatus Rokubacteria bacterium]